MPASKFATQTQFYLPNSIFFQTITGDWGDAAGDEGFTEPDMVLKPDYGTTTAAPWTADMTVQVIHDAFRPPREFRQDILDAMKESAPRRYQESVKRYYRELVQ